MSGKSYWNRVMEFFGFKENERETPENRDQANPEAEGSGEDRVINLSRTQDVKLVVHNPDSFEGVRDIVDDLKNSRAVILNLEKRDKNLSRRLIDFLSGSVYALNGNTQKLGSQVFIFAPPGMDVDARAIENAIRGGFIDAEKEDNSDE
ncbi:cell division protein SepF [Halarsenatibacter silvermanii]|uniref:Cell division protein SepF n=1 Tax=Halarsenatibacter silvermanii TaxID=321763 RepID=A0A1G9JLI4_9FIRM|nr:cell division protein SepF [Halarsenatibacter silvermanii]SDL38368.1 cell division inhibitor SepF [Halarsenatibacter silvermanii]